jgi:UPF0042 nucleotide-binding protein
LGWYVVDNLPTSLVDTIVELASVPGSGIERLALVAGRQHLELMPKVANMRGSGHRVRVLYLDASNGELVKRYEASRRRHPLASEASGLLEAIELERTLLEPMKGDCDLVIDTTHLGVHQLRELVVQRVDHRRAEQLSVTLVSFGFKHGVPGDCDFVFDARTLPNPYWDTALRPLTGRDPAVVRWLDERPEVQRLLDEYAQFIGARIAEHRAAHRRYLTLGIGCTGGQHRSVYLVERLVQRLAPEVPGLSRRHHSLDLPGRT